MRAVQLEPVEAGLGGKARGAHEVVAHALHVAAAHRARPGADAVEVLLRRGRDECPVARGQRLVDAVPRDAGRAFRAGMAELDGDLRVAVGVDEIDDALPSVALRGVPQARAARRDAGLRRGARHLGEDQAGTAHRARAEVHEVIVVGHAVDARVLRHRRDDDAVLQRHAAHRERREHRRRRPVRRVARRARPLGEPVFIIFDVGPVAQPQVLVADALAARQQRVGELLRRQVHVAVDVLEPLGRVARRILDAQHLDAAQVLVALQGAGEVAGMQRDGARQLDRVFERELGARADREVRAVRGVAHQHHRLTPARPVAMHPALAHDAREPDPLGRAAQVSRVRDQRMAVEVFGEEPLAVGDRVVLGHRVEPGRAPDAFRGLDDEGRGAVVEAVGVGLEPAVLGLFEREREGLEHLVRAEPDEAAGAGVDVGPVGGGMGGADAAVQAVAGDDQVGLGVGVVALHIGLEHEPDADLLAAPLQDVEQALAADAAKAVAARAQPVAANANLDVVPVVERLEDLRGAARVGGLQVGQRLVGEHDAPAKGVVGPIALDHGDLVRGVLPLH